MSFRLAPRLPPYVGQTRPRKSPEIKEQSEEKKREIIHVIGEGSAVPADSKFEPSAGNFLRRALSLSRQTPEIIQQAYPGCVELLVLPESRSVWSTKPA